VSGDTRIRVGEGKRKAISAIALQLELKKLKDMNSIAQKTERKLTLLEKYKEAAQAWLESGGGQSELFVHYMIWLFDTGDFSTGLRYADVAIQRQQQMPERFKRDIQTFVADTVLEAMSGSTPNKAAFDTVFERIQVGEWKIHEAILAKYHRYVADAAFDAQDFVAANHHYTEAFKLGAPVKTRLAETAKKLAL
jgi:hypothetical protein